MSNFEEALKQKYLDKKPKQVVSSDKKVRNASRKIASLQGELVRMRKEGVSDEAIKRMNERIMKAAKKHRQLSDMMKSK